jgi:hypothetical protein
VILVSSILVEVPVLNNIIEKSKEAGVNVEKMPDDTNWLDLKYDEE